MQEHIFARDVNGQATWLYLYLHTWHHDLPGIALLGLYKIAVAGIPAFETQALWIARVLLMIIKCHLQVKSRQELQNGLRQDAGLNTCRSCFLM